MAVLLSPSEPSSATDSSAGARTYRGPFGVDSVKAPYMAFCVVFALLAAVFYFIRPPNIGKGKIDSGAGALKYVP
jgi:hypothetical protein